MFSSWKILQQDIVTFFFSPFDWFGLLKPWTSGLLTDDEIEDNFAL
jgi:hypothetical protein